MALRGSRDLTGFPAPQSPTTHARRLISQHMGFVCVCVCLYLRNHKRPHSTRVFVGIGKALWWPRRSWYPPTCAIVWHCSRYKSEYNKQQRRGVMTLTLTNHSVDTRLKPAVWVKCSQVCGKLASSLSSRFGCRSMELFLSIRAIDIITYALVQLNHFVLYRCVRTARLNRYSLFKAILVLNYWREVLFYGESHASVFRLNSTSYTSLLQQVGLIASCAVRCTAESRIRVYYPGSLQRDSFVKDVQESLYLFLPASYISVSLLGPTISIRVGPHFFELLRQEEAPIDASAITLDFSIPNRTYASRITDDQLCQLIVSYGFTRLCHLAGCLWLVCVCVFFFFNFSYVTVSSLLHFLHQQRFAFSSVYVFFSFIFFFHRNSSTLLSRTRIHIRNATQRNTYEVFIRNR